MPNTRRWIVICLFALLAVTGCKHAAADNSSEEILKDQSRRGDDAYQRYRTADYQNAKSALKDYLRYLDQVSANPVAPATVRVEAVITCVRLAKLEEKNHGPELAAYMKEASARCETLKIKMGGCSPENLRKEVDRMDLLPPK